MVFGGIPGGGVREFRCAAAEAELSHFVFNRDGCQMRRGRFSGGLAFLILIWLSFPSSVLANHYDETVEIAEWLWTQGRKVEAVRLFGSVWKERVDDVDRQILYGERSAEVRNWRWSFNFFKVVEPRVKNDPVRLERVYMGYANTYRAAGLPAYAQPWKNKAAALRESAEYKAATKPPEKIPVREPVAQKQPVIVPKASAKPIVLPTPIAVTKTPSRIEAKPATTATKAVAPPAPKSSATTETIHAGTAPKDNEVPPSVTVLRKPAQPDKKSR